MRAVILLLFLAGCTGVEMPDVRRASFDELKKITCGGNVVNCGDVVGAYDHENRIMHLPSEWPDDPALWTDYQQSILIHEFIHHTQSLRGDFKIKCFGALEREAYHVQMAFLRAKGYDNPLAVMGLGPYAYARITSCEG